MRSSMATSDVLSWPKAYGCGLDLLGVEGCLGAQEACSLRSDACAELTRIDSQHLPCGNDVKVALLSKVCPSQPLNVEDSRRVVNLPQRAPLVLASFAS